MNVVEVSPEEGETLPNDRSGDWLGEEDVIHISYFTSGPPLDDKQSLTLT